MHGKKAIILSLAVVVAALSFLLYTGLNANMVYYYHVDEVISKVATLQNENIKINGKVVDGSIHKQQWEYQFVIKGSETNRIPVSYHGVVPDTFKDGSEVVVEGKYDTNAQVFRATTLMAKCPTKYEPQQQKPTKTAEAKKL